MQLTVDQRALVIAALRRVSADTRPACEVCGGTRWELGDHVHDMYGIPCAMMGCATCGDIHFLNVKTLCPEILVPDRVEILPGEEI